MSRAIHVKMHQSHGSSQTAPSTIQASNDNRVAGDACVAGIGARPFPSITPRELEIIGPLIKELALLAANDLSATTVCSEDR